MTVQERVDAYSNALLEVARAEGHLEAVEDDLFRFARVLAGSDELRLALTDPHLPAERRMAIVDELMGGKALATSAALAAFIVGVGRASDLVDIVEAFVVKAARFREREVAEVASALPPISSSTIAIRRSAGRCGSVSARRSSSLPASTRAKRKRSSSTASRWPSARATSRRAF